MTGIEMSASISFAFRTYFSIQHIQSATLMARHASELERNYDGRATDTLITQHHTYVITSLLSSVSFLEATINELFSDAEEANLDHLKGLDENTISLFAEMWRHNIPRTAKYTVLEKYEIALVLARRQPFERGHPPYQEVSLLMKLRNGLIHFEPAWMHSDNDPSFKPEQEHSYIRGLRGKFSLNPIVDEGNPFYPDQCLSHGCAKWAIESSVQFSDLFFAKLGLRPVYEHIRDRLSCD